ncbi:MAG: hypothetical protein AB7S99_00635 [Pseudodonghicola sp.]
MKITLSLFAMPGHPEAQISIAGDAITVDGVTYDLSSVPEGGEASPDGEHPFVGTITRSDGEIVCTVRCLYDDMTAELHQPADPAHWTVTVASGPVVLPIIRKEEPEV